MPCDYKKYPKDWKEIRARILERARNKCELCGISNGVTGVRDKDGQFWLEFEVWNTPNRCEKFGMDWKFIKIVLTIAHVDHDIDNNDDVNLRAWCQRCHLRHDQELHKANAAKTRQRKKAQASRESGQQFLWSGVWP